ncbi:hypothetical protein BDR07DRAFT_1477290 [Suillus spraguei]|nr:hypothetical protein BDR07DRAFT_1477290 [Suillus spraguei]
MADLGAFRNIVSVSEVEEPKVSAPPPKSARPTSNLQADATNPQHHGNVVRGDESSSDEGSEYDPSSRDNNHSVGTVKNPRKYRPQAVIFFSWGVRADPLVRALAERADWDPKEIAAVFQVSVPVIYKTMNNAYATVEDIVSDDQNCYSESEFRELITERPSPSRSQEKKKGRNKKVVDKTFAKESALVPRKQRLSASSPASVAMEVSDVRARLGLKAPA